MGSEVTDLAAGIAAEHLVTADLLLQGYRAFRSDQHMPFDVAFEVDDELLRVQVKATRQQRAVPQRGSYTPAWMWHVRRAGKAGRRVYQPREFDLLALVALDVRRIAYLTPDHQRQTVHIRPDDSIGGRHFADHSLPVALRDLGRLL